MRVPCQAWTHARPDSPFQTLSSLNNNNSILTHQTFLSSDSLITYATTTRIVPIYFLTNPLDKQCKVHYYARQWTKGNGTKGNEAV